MTTKPEYDFAAWDALARLEEATSLRAGAFDEADAAQEEYLDAALEARKCGVPMPKIAEAMGVTVTEAERLGEESER